MSNLMKTLFEPQKRGKLPARYASIVMPLVLSVLMTFVVSAISTLKSLGATPAFLSTWPAAWAISWVVAVPTLLAVLPLVRRIVALVVAPPRPRGNAKKGRPHTPPFPPAISKGFSKTGRNRRTATTRRNS